MPDTDLPLRIAEEVVSMYADAEDALQRRVAALLAQGIETPDWIEKKLAQTRDLRKKADLEVRKLERGLNLVDDKMAEAYEAGAGAGKIEIEADPAFRGSNPQAVEAVAAEKIAGYSDEATRLLESTHLRILRSSLDAYREIISEVVGSGTLTGADTRRQVAMRALNRFAGRGITGFVDSANRSWQLTSYVEMAVRTTSSHAMMEGRLDLYQAAGRDLVIVSDAPEECKICRPWEGRILSISGKDKNYASFAHARASGLFHANCRHDVRPYIKGLTKPLFNTRTADPEGDRQRVRQRYLERRVRVYKRQTAAAEEWLANDKGNHIAQRNLFRNRQMLAKTKTDLNDFIEKYDRKRLRYREQVGGAI